MKSEFVQNGHSALDNCTELWIPCHGPRASGTSREWIVEPVFILQRESCRPLAQCHFRQCPFWAPLDSSDQVNLGRFNDRGLFSSRFREHLPQGWEDEQGSWDAMVRSVAPGGGSAGTHDVEP